MVNRVQVSLILTDDKTASFVETLKKEKRLKTTLVKFLDKFAENPEQVSLWLDSEELELDGAVEENEKLLKLKQSLALFTTFVETAKMQNEANVDNFADMLTNEQYINFRTEFEKSEQLISESNPYRNEETAVTKEENKNLEIVVEDLSEQVKELKTILSEVIMGNASIGINLKNQVTNRTDEYIQVEKETVKEISKNSEELSKSASKQDEIALETEVDNSAEKEEEVDMTDALSIMDSLGF